MGIVFSKSTHLSWIMTQKFNLCWLVRTLVFYQHIRISFHSKILSILLQLRFFYIFSESICTWRSNSKKIISHDNNELAVSAGHLTFYHTDWIWHRTGDILLAVFIFVIQVTFRKFALWDQFYHDTFFFRTTNRFQIPV